MKSLLRWGRHVGVKRALWRLDYELGGARRRELFADLVSSSSPPDTISLDTWLAGLPDTCWLGRVRREAGAGQLARAIEPVSDFGEALEHRAESARQGVVRMFASPRSVDIGQPADWLGSTSSASKWPLSHWTQALGHADRLGDIKDVWELGRQPFICDWMRCFARDGDERWSRALADTIESFVAQNPPRRGPHWASGQECAVRVIVWCLGVAVLGGRAAGWQRAFEQFQHHIWLSARHIEVHLGFARQATPNNHLLLELLALFLVGSLFPRWPDAPRWILLARRVLAREGLAQFYDDGGYCQGSVTYQRFALQALIAWWLLLDDDDPLAKQIFEVIARSDTFLAGLYIAGGRAPNLGANDGASLFGWTECEYLDLRPLLQTTSRIVHGEPRFEAGLWDEASAWWLGVARVGGEPRAEESAELHAPTSGVFSMRRGPWFAALRCGEQRGTSSQLDVGHVELWRDGVPVVRDAGSYRYHPARALTEFARAAAHNTFGVRGAEPLERVGNFSLAGRLKPGIERAPDGLRCWHDGWRRHGLVDAMRELTWAGGRWRVRDSGWFAQERLARISWLLGPGDWSLQRDLDRAWVCRRAGVTIRLSFVHGFSDPEVLLEDAWVSTHYACREPALRLVASGVCSGRVEVVTEFMA